MLLNTMEHGDCINSYENAGAWQSALCGLSGDKSLVRSAKATPTRGKLSCLLLVGGRVRRGPPPTPIYRVSALSDHMPEPALLLIHDVRIYCFIFIIKQTVAAFLQTTEKGIRRARKG